MALKNFKLQSHKPTSKFTTMPLNSMSNLPSLQTYNPSCQLLECSIWKYEIPKLNHKGEKNTKFKLEKSKILNK